MPVNRQGLFAALTTSPLTGDQFASAIDPIARGAGFTPSRWAFNSQEVLLQPQPLPATAPGETAVLPANVRSRDYMIRGGAWEGFIVVLSRTATAPSLPDVAVRRSLNVFRQNFLNGPDAYTDDVGGSALLGSIRDALTRLGAQWMRLAARGVSNAVSWDRGSPEALPLEAAGGSSPSPSPGGGSASSTAGLGLAIAGVVLLGIALYSQDTMPRARRA
jgi:hypothetical protein